MCLTEQAQISLNLAQLGVLWEIWPLKLTFIETDVRCRDVKDGCVVTSDQSFILSRKCFGVASAYTASIILPGFPWKRGL